MDILVTQFEQRDVFQTGVLLHTDVNCVHVLLDAHFLLAGVVLVYQREILLDFTQDVLTPVHALHQDSTCLHEFQQVELHFGPILELPEDSAHLSVGGGPEVLQGDVHEHVAVATLESAVDYDGLVVSR